MTFQEAVCRRIYELCNKYNYTPNNLAESSNIPPSTLQNLTQCKVKNPSSYTIFLLCLTLNISIKDFFDSDLFDVNNIKI